MEVGAHFTKSPVAVSHNYFRCIELCSCFQCPCKSLAVDSNRQSCLAHLIFFYFDGEVTAVNQSCSVTRSGFFCGIFAAQDGKWVMLMAGSASHTLYRHLSTHHRHALHLAFQVMSSVEMHQFPVSTHQIQVHGCCLGQNNAVASLIDKFYATGDDISLFPDAVI